MEDKVAVNGPSVDDWGFEQIKKANPQRAKVLEAAGPPEALIEALATAFYRAIEREQIRLALDSLRNEFVECRIAVQIPVNVGLYDCFFNSRTSYRAQFWISPDAGTAFNTEVARVLRDSLCRRLPERISARRIVTTFPEGYREEEDVGDTTTTNDFIHRSLEPDAAKIWICEWLLQGKSGRLLPIWLPTLSDAEQGPKLSIPKWAKNSKTGEIGEGLRAPYPLLEYAWLDLKGAFVRQDGTVAQAKRQTKRARMLHELGWT